MTCTQFIEQAGTWAIGGLEPAEQAACDAHLHVPEHEPACAEALRRALAAAALMAEALLPVAPRDEVWQAVKAQLGGPAQQGRPAVRRRASSGWLMTFAIAAALALLWNVDHRAQRSVEAQREGEVAALRAELAEVRGDLKSRDEALALLQLPTTRRVALQPQGGTAARGSVLYDPMGRQAVLIASGLAMPPWRDFVLWVVRGGQQLSGGPLRAEAGGTLVRRLDPKLFAGGDPDGFRVTLEPVGMGTAPSGPTLLEAMLTKG